MMVLTRTFDELSMKGLRQIIKSTYFDELMNISLSVPVLIRFHSMQERRLLLRLITSGLHKESSPKHQGSNSLKQFASRPNCIALPHAQILEKKNTLDLDLEDPSLPL